MDDGVVDQENGAFGVSAGLAAAPLFPPEANTDEPAPELFVPREAPCVLVPNPVNAEFAAALFDWGPPNEAKGEEADDGFVVLNGDGLFCDALNCETVELLFPPGVPNGEVDHEFVALNGDGWVCISFG